MDYDNAIRGIGEFGPYQRRTYLLLCLPFITCGLHTMVGVFLAANTDFRCLLPHESPENATYQLSPNLTNTSYPRHYVSEERSQCETYDDNLIDQFYDLDGNFSVTSPTSKCDSFVYDKSTYELTTTMEFNLVCKNSWLRSAADSLLVVGDMIGMMIFGGLADTYGRKPVLYLSFILQAISGLLVAASFNIISYMIFRLIVGSAASGIYLVCYVSVIEMVLPEQRVMSGISAQLFFTIGYILTAGFAYLIRNWKILQIAITVPNLVFLVYSWFIPESARWLVSKGRLEEAKDLLQKASLENGTELSRDTLDGIFSDCSVSESVLEEHSIFDPLKHPNLRRKSFLLFITWFVNSSAYYGLSWDTSNLVGNDYTNFAISGLVEIPAIIFVLLTLNTWGRKNILCGSMLLAGISLLLRIFVTNNLSWLEVVLTMMGKSAITASYVTLYIFTAEQYPTVIRNIGVGVCSTCGSIGACLSPYINYSSIIWKPLPVVIFSSGSLIAALSISRLPETLNQQLPETIEDGEQFGKRSITLKDTSSD